MFPSAKDVGELQTELQETQARIEEKALSVGRVIREVDTSSTVFENGWEAEFHAAVELAGCHLDAMYSPKIANMADFQSRADRALTEFRTLIANTRQRLEATRKGI